MFTYTCLHYSLPNISYTFYFSAEAAAHRFALPPAVPRVPVQQDLPPSPVHNVPSLQNLAMNFLALRLTDPRQPIFSISGLPEHLVQSFLAYLKKEKLLKPKMLHLIPSYLLKLDLDYYPYATNELLHAARIFHRVQILSLKACTLITDAGLNCIKSMKMLKVLNLSGCSQITDHALEMLKDCENLQSLQLDGTKVSNAGLMELSKSSHQNHLVHLDLSRTGITHIFESFQNFKRLKALALKQTQICSLSGVEGLVNLESLDISDTQIVTDSILCLTRLPNLCNISLSGIQAVHGDRALAYLKDLKLTSILLPSRSTTSNIGMSYISGFQLTCLDLTNYINVGDEGMLHVGQIVTLKKLLLSNTKVSDEGMQHLKCLCQLEVLFVDRTLISSAGASVVSNFKNLNELSLSGTSVSDEFIQLGIVNRCLYLTKLNLSRTAISNQGLCNNSCCLILFLFSLFLI